MDSIMDCKEAQHFIHSFLKNELNEQKRYEFIMHVKSCKECMDELRLEFLTTEGINLLDEDDSIDLNGYLDNILAIGVHKNRVKRHVKASFVALAAMIACVLLLVGSSGFIY